MKDTERIARATAHRPWPMPNMPWVMFQSWQQLLFAHWPIPASVLRPLIPPQLTLEEFDGTAWLGQTPFVLRDLRPRGIPAVPAVSDFPEMNLRTYVRYGSRSGIWFFTLEAASSLAVSGARTFFRLPYHHARMTVRQTDGWIDYRSERTSGDVVFHGRYRPVGLPEEPRYGTLEHFLVERYALFTVLRSGRVLRCDIHHTPWRLHQAEAEIARNTLPQAYGITLPGTEPLLHYSERQDSLIWAPELDG
ncbi:MAG: YqjF family protein [Longimicrobiales bacterium]